MNWKLFLSTFALIFLAELGDKTQLASMARAATGEGAKWTVFAAASSALVVSTLIAVLLGTALTRVVPEHVIKIAAAVLFILFGVLILADVVRKRAPAPAAAEEVVRPGPLTRVVLNLAAGFEEAAWADYAKLAAGAADPRFRTLLETLAAEEQRHLERVRSAGREHGEVQLDAAGVERLPAEAALAHDVADSDRPALQHLMEHEEATARFYEELARVTHVPGLKRVFSALAAEERDHLRRLRAFADGPAAPA